MHHLVSHEIGMATYNILVFLSLEMTTQQDLNGENPNISDHKISCDCAFSDARHMAGGLRPSFKISGGCETHPPGLYALMHRRLRVNEFGTTMEMRDNKKLVISASNFIFLIPSF